MISRSIMLNPEIPVESKAIYSILAVFAGDKDRCFPTIKTLVEATGISKDRLSALRAQYPDIYDEFVDQTESRIFKVVKSAIA